MADVTDATFQADVIERSREVPVVVDLWASWCGPCKTLGPILDKVVGDSGGRVELVKIDVDANPQSSAAFRVQSIPAVYALKDGKVVDSFVGAQPEAAVRTFVDKLLPTEAEDELVALLAAGDELSLRRVLDAQADHPVAVVALADLLVDDGREDEALALLQRLPESAETRRVAARARVGEVGEVDDTTARLDALLEQVKGDEEARQEYLDVLELMGSADPRTATYRKKLTARLF